MNENIICDCGNKAEDWFCLEFEVLDSVDIIFVALCEDCWRIKYAEGKYPFK